MKLEVWAATKMVGSNVKRIVEIDDEELEGLTDEQKSELIEEVCQEEMWQMLEWGYDEV